MLLVILYSRIFVASEQAGIATGKATANRLATDTQRE